MFYMFRGLVVMKKIVSTDMMMGGICMMSCFVCLKKPRSIGKNEPFIVQRRESASFLI